MSPLTEPTKLTLAKTYVGVDDPDAATYIAAVEAADEAASPGVGALETATKVAIHSFVKGCKADGIWPAIKASCILAGARTLSGALVPLTGTAPTNFNFVSGDYDRKTGLVGNGSTKYLNSNRANNADPQNSNHNACWVSASSVGALMASSSSNSGQNYMDTNTSTNTRFASRSNVSTQSVSGSTAPGLYGHSRSDSANMSYRCPQGSASFAQSSQSPESRNVFLYTRTNDGISFSQWSAARLAFYSIGESLDLALLDARISALIAAFAAAIP
jgi:hypothetical protein